MKQYLTELRKPWRGAFWAGPVIEADNRIAANLLLMETPYKVVGELIQTVSSATGKVARHVISRETSTLVH